MKVFKYICFNFYGLALFSDRRVCMQQPAAAVTAACTTQLRRHGSKRLMPISPDKKGACLHGSSHRM
jgi:nucleotidyltransferase/DNA polymerase involved in DNA repair